MTAPPGSTGQDRDATGGGRQSRSSEVPRSGSQSGSGSESRSGPQSRPPGADIAGAFQRWLIRSSARNMRRELTGQFRRTFGSDTAEPGDVWSTATTEPPPDESREAPECAWCPVCRAARRIRESGPGLGGQLAGAGDAVAAAVQEALSAFDAVLSMRPRTDAPGDRPSRAGATAAGPPAAGPAANGTAAPGRRETPVAGAPSEGPDREPDDRG